MSSLHVKIITPRKVVIDEEATVVTVPSVDGEISILPHHAKLLTQLQEGIITIKSGSKEDFLAIGGGFLETDGNELKILVSRAYKQDEIDEEQTKKALEQAKNAVAEQKGKGQIEATSIIRRSLIDLKLLKKRKAHARPPGTQSM